MRTTVIVMSKIPLPGFTNTRLNSVLTEQESADFHRACLQDVCRAIRMSSLPGFIYYTAPNETPSPLPPSFSADDLWGLSAGDRAYFKMHPQQGEDLGERLYHAAQEVLTNYEAVLLLGSDMPAITPELIWEAQANLLNSEITIGPAQDGGYYLLGIREASPTIFQNIPWGTAEVFAITLQRIKAQLTKYSLLPAQADIDTWDDLINFYNVGQATENNFIRQLVAYKMAATLVAKYGYRGKESKEWIRT